MAIETYALIILGSLAVVLGASALLSEPAEPSVCPIEPCQANFIAIFSLHEKIPTNTFTTNRATIRIQQECTIPDGTYKQIDCSFDRNYTIATTTDFILPIDVNKNPAASLVPLSAQVDLIIPENLDRFADANSVFTANCWVTQAGLNGLGLNAPERDRSVLSDTVFSESNKFYACSEIKEVQ